MLSLNIIGTPTWALAVPDPKVENHWSRGGTSEKVLIVKCNIFLSCGLEVF